MRPLCLFRFCVKKSPLIAVDGVLQTTGSMAWTPCFVLVWMMFGVCRVCPSEATVRGSAYTAGRLSQRAQRRQIRLALDAAAVTCEVDNVCQFDKVSRALSMVESVILASGTATLADIGISSHHQVSFDFRDKDNGRLVEAGVSEYILTMLWTVHTACRQAEQAEMVSDCSTTRSLMLLLMRMGLRADVPFNTGQHTHAGLYSGTPVGSAFANDVDPHFAQVMAQAGHNLRPMVGGRNASWSRHLPRDEYGRQGYS